MRVIRSAIDAGHLIEADRLMVVGFALVDRVAMADGTHPRRVVAIQSLELWGDSDSEHEKVYRLKSRAEESEPGHSSRAPTQALEEVGE